MNQITLANDDLSDFPIAKPTNVAPATPTATNELSDFPIAKLQDDDLSEFPVAKEPDRRIRSPYSRGVAEGTIEDTQLQPERRKFGEVLGYAPEQALATLTQVADFPAHIERGAQGSITSLAEFAIGEENTAKIKEISLKLPIIGKLFELNSKYLETSGKIKNEAQQLLRREAMERGGLPGVVASELVGTVQDTLMFLASVQTLGIGYSGQAGVATTLKSAAVRATFGALTAENLSPKERLSAFGWGMAYQSTPALSSTVGRWAKSDMLAKTVDVFANAGITGVQVPRMIEESYARAEAEGRPNMGGFYFTLEAIKAFGSDVVFGVMTKAFKDTGEPKAAVAMDALATRTGKLSDDIQKADEEVKTQALADKTILPSPDRNQLLDKAATPLTMPDGAEGISSKRVDIETGKTMVKQPDGSYRPEAPSNILTQPEGYDKPYEGVTLKEAPKITPEPQDIKSMPAYSVFKTTIGGNDRWAVISKDNTGKLTGHELFNSEQNARDASESMRQQDNIRSEKEAATIKEKEIAATKEAATGVSQFISDMTPMKSAKTRNFLSKVSLFGGKPSKRSDMIEKKVADGAVVLISKNGERRLHDKNDPYSPFLDSKEIGVTALDYAEFLIKNRSAATSPQDAKDLVTKSVSLPKSTPEANINNRIAEYNKQIQLTGLVDRPDGSTIKIMASDVVQGKYEIVETIEGKRKTVSDPTNPMSLEDAQKMAVDIAVNGSKVTPKPEVATKQPPKELAKKPVLRLTGDTRAGASGAEQKLAASIGSRIYVLKALNDRTNAYPDETFDRIDPAQIDEVRDYMIELQRPPTPEAKQDDASLKQVVGKSPELMTQAELINTYLRAPNSSTLHPDRERANLKQLSDDDSGIIATIRKQIKDIPDVRILADTVKNGGRMVERGKRLWVLDSKGQASGYVDNLGAIHVIKDIPIDRIEKRETFETGMPQDTAKIEQYASLKTKAPMISAYGLRNTVDTYQIFDGHHRYEAAKQRGDKTISADLSVSLPDGSSVHVPVAGQESGIPNNLKRFKNGITDFVKEPSIVQPTPKPTIPESKIVEPPVKESDFNTAIDSVKKIRMSDGKRMTEGQIRAQLESDPTTGNKGRFKDMTPEEGQSAMNIMQRMIDEQSVVPATAELRTDPKGTVVSIQNADIERQRAEFNLPPGLEKIRVSDPQAWDDAMTRVAENPNAGYDLTNDLSENPRPTDKWENALLLRHLVQVNLEHTRAANATIEATKSGDPTQMREANLRYEKASELHTTVANVVDKTGTLTAQALQSRKMFADEEFNLATMIIHRKAATGKKSLSTEELSELKKISDDYEKTIAALQAKVSELEQQERDKRESDDFKEDIDRKAKDKSDRERKSGKIPDLAADREKAVKSIENKMETGKVESLADLQDPIQKLALYFEQKSISENDGKSVLTRDELVDSVHGVIKTVMPDVTPNEVRDAITGYGRATYPSQEAAKVALRQHKSELLKVAPLETIQKNIEELKAKGASAAKELESTKHTGYQRDEIHAKARDLTKELQSAMKEQDKLMKELGIETGDPAMRLKTALDAKKTRLRNQIDDINQAIKDQRELSRNKGVTVDDDEIRALTIQRDIRLSEYKEVFPDKPMTPEQRNEIAVKAAERNLAAWEERAAQARKGIFKAKDPIEKLPETKRMALLRRETGALKAEVAYWKELAHPKATPEERRLAAWKTRTEKTTAELERRIAEKDFSKKPRPEPVTLDREGFAMMKAVDAVKGRWANILEKERLRNRTWTQKLWDRSTEPFNVARSLMASMDLSATLRQGLVLGVAHPSTAVKAIPDQIKAFVSEHQSYKTNQKIINDELYSKMVKAKVEFTDPGGKMSNMEESFMSRLSSRIPGIKQSSRAYSTYLNKLRADVFVVMYKTLAKSGELTDSELLTLGRYVNMATGRGNLGKHALASQTFATIFWAPRLFISRFQLLAGAPMYHGSARTRKLIAGEYARFLGGMSLVYILADLMGAEIELDPRSGSFGKLKFGSTRVDPLAGLSQATTLVARLATGKTKTQAGEIESLRAGDKKAFARGIPEVISQFLRSKLSPLIGTAVDVDTGETMVGDPVTLGSIIKRSVVPLAFQDIYDSMIEQGIAKGTALSILAIFGMGVQTYDTARDKQDKKNRAYRQRVKIYNAQQSKSRDTKRAARGQQ